MALRLFITGTDTNIGKTYISCGLLRLFTSKNITNLGIKPISCGKTKDSDLLGKNSYIKCDKNFLYHFKEELAPHIAAHINGITLSVDSIINGLESHLRKKLDVIVIEGAGGWLVPLNSREYMADLARAFKAKIILVVGMRLGCINHALLSYREIVGGGNILAGWVANCVDANIDQLDHNIAFLKSVIKAPLLGIVPCAGQPEFYLSVEDLF